MCVSVDRKGKGDRKVEWKSVKEKRPNEEMEINGVYSWKLSERSELTLTLRKVRLGYERLD